MFSELSLSTAWSKDKYKCMEEFVRDVHEFGYSSLELHSSITEERLRELLDHGSINISSVHSPCPARRNPQGIWSTDLSLSALNREVRMEAVELAMSTIELASRVGAKVVVLHAGYVELQSPWVRKLRQIFEQGLDSTSEYKKIKKGLIDERSSKIEDHMEAAKESIRILLDHAYEKGILIALENRVNYHEIPCLEEMEQLLSFFANKPVRYWHDVGHAEVQDRLGFKPHHEWFSRLGSKTIGVHFHDVRGIHDHFAPGMGSLEWDFVSENIPKDVIKVCELAEWNAREDVHQAVYFLRGKGI